MRNFRGLFIFSIFLLILDFYVFQVVKYLSSGLTTKQKLILYIAYWLISIFAFVIIFLFPTWYFIPKYKLFITYSLNIVVGLFFFKLITAAFLLIDDVRRVITWIIQKLGFNKPTLEADMSISRSGFLSWLGIAIGGTVFSSLLVGFSNKYNYRIKNVALQFPNLPNAFKGLKVVQLSDIHSGSFNNIEAVNKGVEMVLAQKPDLILFTGDLVNNISTEMENYKDVFAKLQAPLGVYSVLGNHDYGDYYQWKDRDNAHIEKEKMERAKLKATLNELITKANVTGKELDSLTKKYTDQANFYRLYSPLQQQHLDELKNIQKNMGWKLLMNEHVVLEKGEDKIAVIGIENWGARGNFPRYGKLDEAYKGTEGIPFKILLSHDPSHWDAQITEDYNDIDLTLSGHTHGMQFGVEIPGLKWSPIQYIYKQWAGIYQKSNQKLYVNRGFGFLGYSGRVGIMPEITVFELT